MQNERAGGTGILPGSFRDPTGSCSSRDGILYRQINRRYREDYEHLIKSGLYRELTGEGLLVTHGRVDAEPFAPGIVPGYKAREVPFVSYPYEWCFSQLKAAALTTLAVQKMAPRHGMSLKDASAYNIQFLGGKPI